MKRFLLIGMLLGAVLAATVSQADAQVVYRRSLMAPRATYSYYAAPGAYYYGSQTYTYPRQTFYPATTYYSYPQTTYYGVTTPGSAYYYTPNYYVQPYWGGNYWSW